jgi:hypothetical protein
MDFGVLAMRALFLCEFSRLVFVSTVHFFQVVIFLFAKSEGLAQGALPAGSPVYLVGRDYSFPSCSNALLWFWHIR